MLAFRMWLLESEEEYNRLYRDKMQQAWSEQPRAFQHWFPQGENRIYMPFTVKDSGDITYNINNVDKSTKEVRDSISIILDRNGYKLLDFRKGFANKQQDKRAYKIGAIFKEIEKRVADPNMKSQLVQALNDFMQAPIRLNDNNEMMIVISQDPHDVAKMSYDRNWTSCMRLPDKKNPLDSRFVNNSHMLPDEVREGGIIAYLIDPQDKDIKRPYSRLLIRHFSDEQGASFAICENRIYGINVPEFLNEIKKWVAQKQEHPIGKVLNRRGSDWSDTYQSQEVFHLNPEDVKPGNEKLIVKDLQAFVQQDDSGSLISMLTMIIQKRFDQQFIYQTVEYINDNVTKMSEANHDYYKFLPMISNFGAVHKIPQDKVINIFKMFGIEKVADSLKRVNPEVASWLLPILKEMLKSTGLNNMHKLAELINKVPELATKEFIDSLPDKAMETIYAYNYQNPDIKKLTVNRIANQKRKLLIQKVKEYNQTQDESLVDEIDQIVRNMMAFLDERYELALKVARKILPPELYEKLYGGALA